MRIQVNLLLVAVIFAAHLSHASAQAEVVQSGDDTRAYRLAKEISDTTMSPYCPGMTLSACPSDKARILRGAVESMAKTGMSEHEIRRKVEEDYGRDLSGVPSTWTSWVPPVAFLVIGGLFILWTFFRRDVSPESADSE